jgi:hypothetical protein
MHAPDHVQSATLQLPVFHGQERNHKTFPFSTTAVPEARFASASLTAPAEGIFLLQNLRRCPCIVPIVRKTQSLVVLSNLSRSGAAISLALYAGAEQACISGPRGGSWQIRCRNASLTAITILRKYEKSRPESWTWRAFGYPSRTRFDHGRVQLTGADSTLQDGVEKHAGNNFNQPTTNFKDALMRAAACCRIKKPRSSLV